MNYSCMRVCHDPEVSTSSDSGEHFLNYFPLLLSIWKVSKCISHILHVSSYIFDNCLRMSTSFDKYFCNLRKFGAPKVLLRTFFEQMILNNSYHYHENNNIALFFQPFIKLMRRHQITNPPPSLRNVWR